MLPSSSRPSKKQLGDAVRDYLSLWNVTQEAFAMMPPEMTPGTLNRFIQGTYLSDYPDTGTLTRISKKLKFPSVDKFERFCAERNFYGIEAVRYCIAIGDAQTLWLRFAGNGERGAEISPSNIRCRLDPAPFPVFPQNIQNVIDRVRREHAAGRLRFENNKLAALGELRIPGARHYVVDNIDTWPPKGINEDRKLELIFKETDYASFFAIARDLEGQRIRNESLRWWRPERGIEPHLSFGVGINVAIFSGDDKFIVGYRASMQGARPGEIDVGAVEGISLRRDLMPDGTINLHDVVRRALHEEYDITAETITEMHVLGFGYDLQYCQWNALAVCYCASEADRILKRQRTSALDQAEFFSNQAIEGGPGKIFEFLGGQQKIWSCGLAAAFYACVHKYGKEKVLAETLHFELFNKVQYYTAFHA